MNTIDKLKNVFKTKGKIIIPVCAIILILSGSTFLITHNKNNVSAKKTETTENKEKEVVKEKNSDNTSAENKEKEESSNTKDKEKATDVASETTKEEKVEEPSSEPTEEAVTPEATTETSKEEKVVEPISEPVVIEPTPEPVVTEPTPEPTPEPTQSYPSTSEVQQRLISYGQSIGLVYDSSLVSNGFELQGSEQAWSSERGNSPDRWLVDGVKAQNYKSFAIAVTDLGNGFCSMGVYVSMYE